MKKERTEIRAWVQFITALAFLYTIMLWDLRIERNLPPVEMVAAEVVR